MKFIINFNIKEILKYCCCFSLIINSQFISDNPKINLFLKINLNRMTYIFPKFHKTCDHDENCILRKL